MERDRHTLAETDVRTPMAWQHRDQLYGYQHNNGGAGRTRTASPMDTSNTSSMSSESHIRSMLGAWDGEPYAVPVHMPLPLPLALPLPPHMPPPMMLPPPGPPAILLPPMLRPRPLVFPAVPSSPTPPEPLPVREPKSTMLALPPKELAGPRRKIRCCRGGCIVFWIILGIIFVGVVLATALRFVVP